MATANEILNSGGDPNTAFGSSSLPTGNAVTWDMSGAVNAWQEYANNKLAVAKAYQDDLKAKQLKQQEQVAKALDAGQYKIWEADRDLFKKKWEDFQVRAIDVAKRGKWGDVNDEEYENVLKMQAELDQFAQYSTQQQANHTVAENDYRTNPARWIDAESTLNSYKGIGDPFARAQVDLDLKPQGGWNVYEQNNEIVKSVVEENPEGITSQNIGGNNLLYTIPMQVDQAKLNTQINANLDANRDGINGYIYEFSIQSPEVKQRYAASSDPARAWAYDVKLASLPLDVGSKNSIHQINYAPSAGATQKKNEAALSERKRLIYLIQNKDPQALDILRGLKYQGLPIKDVKYGTKVIERDRIQKQIEDKQKTIQITSDQNKVETLNKEIEELKLQLERSPEGERPTTIEITTTGGKKFSVEVSDETGGGFQAINNLVNDIAGQEKFSLEDLATVPAYTPSFQQESVTETISEPTTLSGKIDPKTLVKGQQYIVNGKTYIWDGAKLKPR